MWLPSQAQVNAASRHVASAIGGAIIVFGLSTKIDVNTVNAIVTATGTLVNDAVVLIGLVSPLAALPGSQWSRVLSFTSGVTTRQASLFQSELDSVARAMSSLQRQPRDTRALRGSVGERRVRRGRRRCAP